MEVTTEITRTDYAAFNSYYLRKKRIKRILIVYILLGAAIPFRNADSRSLRAVDFVYSFAVLALVFLLMVLILRIIVGYLPSKKGYVLGPKKYVFHDDEFDCLTENMTTSAKYSAIRSVESDKESVYLFVDSMAAYIIPKRSLKDISEVDFIAFVKSKMGRPNN